MFTSVLKVFFIDIIYIYIYILIIVFHSCLSSFYLEAKSRSFNISRAMLIIFHKREQEKTEILIEVIYFCYAFPILPLYSSKLYVLYDVVFTGSIVVLVGNVLPIDKTMKQREKN